MKRILVLSIFSLATLLTATVHAGVISGGGGNSILCESNGKTSVELLDFYEVRLSGKTLNLNPKLGSYTAMLQDLFKKWNTVASGRMILYNGWLNEFALESAMYPDIEIPEIPDTGNVAIPRGCTLRPAAFQRPDDQILPGVKRYIIDKNIWDLMPEVQKAGLVLHELIYRESMAIGHTTSFPTRYFNGYLASATPQSEEYISIVSRLPLSWGEYGKGMVLKIGSVMPPPERFIMNLPFNNEGYFTGPVNELIPDFENIWSIRGNIDAKNIKIDMGGTVTSGGLGTFAFYPTKLNFQLVNSAGFKSLHANFMNASIGLSTPRNKQYFGVTIRTRDPLEGCLNIQLESSDENPPDKLKLDPKFSWLKTRDGQIIKGIKTISRKPVPGSSKEYSGDITTESGEVWKLASPTFECRYVRQ